MPNVQEIIRDHVSLSITCIDRLYVNGYMPGLQTSGQLCDFLRKHLGHPIPSPALFRPIHDRFIERLVEVVRAYVPGVEPEPIKVEPCLYTTTPDEDFIIERAGPVVVASPCSGHGFKFGPAMGRLITAFATGKREPPARFRLPRPPGECRYFSI